MDAQVAGPRSVDAVLVVFDGNAHPDQIEATRTAILQLRGVIGVTDPTSWATTQEAVRSFRRVVSEARALHERPVPVE